MRILSINSDGTLTGGAEAVHIYSSQLLSDNGHTVAMLHIGETVPFLDSKISVYSLGEFRNKRPLQKQLGLVAGFIYHPQAYRLAKQALQAFQPDVVHIHNIQGQLSPAVLLPFKQQGIPVVQTLHDYRLLCPAIHFLSRGQVCEACVGQRFYQCMLKRCRQNQWLRSTVAALGAYISHYAYHYNRLVSAYIAPSEFMRNKMIDFGYSPADIYTLPNAYFGPIAGPKKTRRHHVLYVGRLSPEKGVDLLVHAAKNLNITVKLAGDGPERPRLQAIAAHTNTTNIQFLGHLPPVDISHLYQTALLTVLPSRWYENGPLVLLESYAHATPVVSARIGAIPEFIQADHTGLLFEPNNPEDLSRALQTALASPAKLKMLGENARNLVSHHYSPAAYLAGLLTILDTVVARGSHGNH